MDPRHRFHTDETWRWVRAEQIALAAGLIVATALHARAVCWPRFVAAFAALDVIGYLPGMLAQRRAGAGRIAPLYHHLYNWTHSWLTVGAAVACWALALGHLEWAMTAPAIHMAGDRGWFGNTYKPVSLPFETGPRRLA